ncbi:MAG: hypothetical protein IKF72_06900 [Kiritimatiellae bacterium]|nr:hypothetical protein [Kiritimatiellia bacterium]
MPLGINGYNDTFKAFTDFATQAKGGSTIAQVGGEKNTVVGAGPLAGRTIVAKTGFDFIGNVGRRQASRDVNNEVRELFKQAIADLFHGESNIPMSVLDAMKLADFGKGKPLTARRILAVKAAIDQAAAAADQGADAAGGIDAKIESAVETCMKKFGKKPNAKAEPLVRIALEACNGDADVMDIVTKNITKKILYTGTSDLRTEADIRQKVGDIAASLEELKAASNGNPAVVAAGKAFLMEHGGNTLPRGLFTKMAEAAAKIPLDQIRDLSASSPARSIHKAVADLNRALDDAMVSSGVANHLEAPEERTNARLFLTSVAMSQCNQVALRNIHDALNSNSSKQLLAFYRECRTEDFQQLDGQSEDIRKGAESVADECELCLRGLDAAVNENINRMNPSQPKMKPIPFIDDNLNMRAVGGDKMVSDIVSAAEAYNAKRTDDYINATVTGSGQGAEVMKNLLRAKLGNASKPEEKLGKSLSANAKAMMNWNICGEMKKIVTGKECQFKADIYRGTNVTLTNGKNSFKLTMKFETARDELAQFVTGDANATYEGLTKAEDKNKVHLLMALVSQETEKAAQMGSEIAIEPRESDQAFGEWFKHDGQSRSYTVKMRHDGGIALHYVMDNEITDIKDNTTNDGLNDEISVGEGSRWKCTLDYTLKGDEFNRLAKLDFSKFDDSEGVAFFEEKEDMPDGTRQSHANKLEGTVNKFAQEFKVKAEECMMDFTMNLKPTLEDEIAAQRDAGPIVA